jgi:plasmid segregation protein ParM
VEELIIGIDAGNNEVKACGPSGVDKFPSDIGEYRDRRLKQQHSPDDMVWEYNGKKGFAGTLARYESEYNGKMMGSTKAHEDTLLRVLLALHRQDDEVFHLVVGQPIESHTEVQKAKIITMLTGAHRITVNGRAKTLHIADVKVAAEGGASYWSCPVPGVVHQLDIGSGTINWATLIDGRYIDKDSFTLGFGANNTKTYDLEAMARAIATKARCQGRVRLVGGLAEEIRPYIRKYFPAEVQYPIVTVNDECYNEHPVFANAVGFYEIARGVYG